MNTQAKKEIKDLINIVQVAMDNLVKGIEKYYDENDEIIDDLLGDIENMKDELSGIEV